HRSGEVRGSGSREMRRGGSGETRCATDAAANPSADPAAVLRGGPCHRNSASRESRGREGCKVDARVPHGTTSRVTHPIQYLKVAQSFSRGKALRPPTVKNRINDCLFRIPIWGPMRGSRGPLQLICRSPCRKGGRR